MITLEHDRLTITDWATNDPDIVRFFAALQGDDERAVASVREELFLRVLKVGVVALQRTQTQVDLDAIRREFDAWQAQITNVLASIFSQDSGQLILALNEYLGQGGKLGDLFDPERSTSAIGRIQAIFDLHFSGDGAKFTRLLDYTTDGSPLKKLHSALEQKFKDLDGRITVLAEKLAFEQGRAEEYARGTQKGLDFEGFVKALLDPVARVLKDTVIPVGIEIGGESKKGDLLIELSPDDADGQTGITIVVECKRQETAVGGKTGILQELEQAMVNRNAGFGLAVFSADACPKEIGRLRLYPGNRLICSITDDGSDAFVLEAAYQLARAELCRQLRQNGQQIDRGAVAAAIRKAEEKLNQFQGLKANVTRLERAAGEVRSQLDAIEQDIRSALMSVVMELSEVSE